MAQGHNGGGNSNPRDGSGKFQSGHGGSGQNPRHALTAALRRLVDPDQIAKFVLACATNEKGMYSPNDQRWAIELCFDRLEGKAVQSIAMAVATTATSLPPNFDNLTLEQKEAAIDALVGASTLTLPGGE